MKPPIAIHLVTSLDFGGVEKRMLLLRKAAASARFEHRFCAIAGGGAIASELAREGAQLDLLNLPYSIPSFPTIKALTAYLRRSRATVLHCHGAEANFHGLLAGFLARIPVRFGEEIGIPRHSHTARRVFREVYRSAHAVVAISDAVREWLVESGEVSPQKAIRIYNPVQIPNPGAASRPDKLFRIGFVGRLEPIKNASALINAVAGVQVEARDVELWIIGEGSERDRLETLSEDLKLSQKVRFWGFQSDPAPLLRQCHVYVQPSLAEGFGLAIVEAMGCGLPVVATAVGGAREIIEDGRSGWLVAPTPQALRGAIFAAATMNPASLNAMGLYARSSVVGRFEAASYVRELEAAYNSVGQVR